MRDKDINLDISETFGICVVNHLPDSAAVMVRRSNGSLYAFTAYGGGRLTEVTDELGEILIMLPVRGRNPEADKSACHMAYWFIKEMEL